MICRYCGKEFQDDARYCPYCAEPVPVVQTQTQEEKGYDRKMLLRLVVKCVCAIVVCSVIFFLFLWGEGLSIAIVCTSMFLVLSIGLVVLEYVLLTKPGKDRTINMQFTKDQTSICPKCGSHNIKIYRKGYDYKVGFWGSIFKVRGSGYAGGFDANTACCRCMNCGNDWETDYDYRLL